MRAIGVDPHALTPDDPAWHACHTLPRGWAVREVAAAMRAEGWDLRLADAQVELLRRVAVRQAEHKAPVLRKLGPTPK